MNKSFENRMSVEIIGVYDGVAFYFYPKTKTFEWQPKAIQRTTEKYRKDFEENFLKDFE